MSQEIKIRKTPIGKSYWDENGAYQSEYDKLYKELVPDYGTAKTLNGELIRSISRLFHEYCNNGNCNSVEIESDYDDEYCSECGGSGEVYNYSYDEECEYDEEYETCVYCDGIGLIEEENYSEPKVTPFYQKFLDLIIFNVPNSYKIIHDVESIILKNESTFSDEDMDKYNKMCDNVIHYVLTNEDKPLPIGYDIEI